MSKTQKEVPVPDVNMIALANIFIKTDLKSYLPPLDEIESDTLQTNIETYGIREPLTLAMIEEEQGLVLLDGHNRLEIAKKLGLSTVPAIVYKMSGLADCELFMVQNQLGKRNLSVKQRALLALQAEPQLKEQAKLRQAGQVQQNSGESGEVSKQLAKMAKTSHDTIAKIKTIRDKGLPELLTYTDNGISINGAHKIAVLPLEEQGEKIRECLENKKSKKPTNQEKEAECRARLFSSDERYKEILFHTELETEFNKNSQLSQTTYTDIFNNLMDGKITLNEAYELFLIAELQDTSGFVDYKNNIDDVIGIEIDSVLYRQNAKNVLNSIKTGTVDLVLTDPPYNTNIEDWDKDFKVDWIMREFARILRPGGSALIFCSEHILPLYFQYQNPNLTFYQMMIWNKPNPAPRNQVPGNITMKQYLHSTELILWFVKGFVGKKNKDKAFFKKNACFKPELIDRELCGNTRTNVFSMSTVGNRERVRHQKNEYIINTEALELLGLPEDIDYKALLPPVPEKDVGKGIHSTQKTERLIKALMDVHSNVGDLICDPFSGTGTTASVCAQNNRKFVGSELDIRYYYYIQKRLNALKHNP